MAQRPTNLAYRERVALCCRQMMFKKRASLSARMHEPSRQEQRALRQFFVSFCFFAEIAGKRSKT